MIKFQIFYRAVNLFAIAWVLKTTIKNLSLSFRGRNYCQSSKKFVMKELPDEQTLLELLKLAKDAEQKARELNEMGERFHQKWLPRLEGRRKILKQ